MSGVPAMNLPLEKAATISHLLVFMKENRWERALQRQPYGKTGAAAREALVLLMAAVSTDMLTVWIIKLIF